MLDCDPFLEYFPGDGVKAKFVRFLRRQTSIDPDAHRTRENLKSLTVIKAETFRHLLFYPNTIHCFSRFRYLWETLMMITYGLAFLVIPIHVAFINEEERLETSIIPALVSIINVIYMMDIAINFLSSYQDEQTKHIVLDRRKIAVHYLNGYFWIDALSSLPDRLIIQLLYSGTELKGNDLDQCVGSSLSAALTTSECLWDIIIILSLLKFLQLPLFFKYLVNYLEQHGKSVYSVKIIRNAMSLIFLFHFSVSVNYLVMRIFSTERFVQLSRIKPLGGRSSWTETTDVEKYIICFFYMTSTLTLFASAIEEKSQVDMTIGIVFTLIGSVVNIWLVSQALMYVTTSHGPAVRFQEIRFELIEYVAFKRIPKSVQSRILAYYDYTFRGQFYRRDIGRQYMEGMRHLITTETCQKHLLRNYLFKSLPDNLLHAIASCMVETIYLRNDVICRNDRHRGQKLYLIVNGAVAVYTQDGREMAHLYDGNMFGENEFIQYRDARTCMNYVAAEESSILVLHRNDFMRVMADNVELINHMRKLLREEGGNFIQPQLLDSTSPGQNARV